MNNPKDTLRHHVTGAIERGEAEPIVEQPEMVKCPYPFCHTMIPKVGAGAGVSLSRKDNKTNICSACGTREALIPKYMELLNE